MPKPLKLIVATSVIALSCFAQSAVLTPAQLGYANNMTLDTLHAACKHVAIIPVPVPIFPGVDQGASARIESTGSRVLQAAGFELVSANAYDRARQQVIAEAGGLYNPGTGFKRNDVAAKAVDTALKALLSNPQVDCFATIHAERTKASVAGRYAYFNGVREFVDGGANGTMSQILLGSTGTGTIGAVSLVIQIYDRNEKQLYGRFGGVQLTTYLDHQHGDGHGNYLNVAPEALLQDDKRIERALKNITVPLRYTPDQIDAGNTDPKTNPLEIDPSEFPKPPPGQHRTDRPLLVPRDQILSSVHRVVIGILAPNGLTSSPEVVARYRSLVHEQLTRLGWEVIDSDQINAAFGKAAAQVGGIFDPVTGKTDPNRLKGMMQTALNSLALPAAPDGVALISLVRTSATQVAGNAEWDGTQQSALTLGPVIDRVVAFGGTVELNAGEGTMGAASFNFTLRDANGTLLMDSRGGIQLLQKLSLQKKKENGSLIYAQTLTNLTPAELFTDPARDLHAVTMALLPLQTPPSAAAENR